MKQYLQLLKDILDQGEDHRDRTGVGTKSLFGYQIRHNFSEGFPLLTTKKIPFRWVLEELKWFLSGSTDESKLREKGIDIWKEWADESHTRKFGRRESDLGPIYGGLWRRFPIGHYRNEYGHFEIDGPKEIDQINWLMDEIRKNPNSRRLIVSGWHPWYQQRVELPPCHTLWQIKCHGDSEMSLHLYARSIDAFLGLPFNIASYATLLCLICKLTNRNPKTLIISFGDVHIYNNHHKQVEEQLKRTPKQLPELDLQVNTITDFSYELLRYDPLPSIQAEVAV